MFGIGWSLVRCIHWSPPLQAQIHHVQPHKHMKEKAVGSNSLKKRHKRPTQAKHACDKLRNKRKTPQTDPGGKNGSLRKIRRIQVYRYENTEERAGLT